MKSSTKNSILLLVAMVLTLLPAHLEVACEVVTHPDADPCDLLLADSFDASASSNEPAQGGDNCCETGCQHCSLPCCTGTAMIPAAPQLAEASTISNDRLVTTNTDVTWVDLDQFYHPPRA